MPRASSVNTTRAARRIAYFAIGAALLSIPTLAIADETFVQQATVFLPTGSAPLASFDISWIDPTLHMYFLADRSNKSIDIIDNTSSKITGSTTVSSQIIPTGNDAFAGFTGNNDTSGPNGVLTVDRSGHGDHDHDADDRGSATIWVGDGPTPQSKATTGATCAATPPGSATPLAGTCSTVKIFALGNNDPIRIVPTNGQARADELCYDPNDHLVMIANDADNPPFLTFISTEGNNRVLGQITIPESTGGIEQCQYNPRNGMIYLNIPSTTDHPNGAVYVIEPRREKIVAKYDAGTNCWPTGMAIGPDHQILLGCGTNPAAPPHTTVSALNANIMDDNGNIIGSLTGQGGNDEVWFNPGDGHYLLAESKNANGTNPQLGIADSLNEEVDQDYKPTGTSSHSVAADPNSKQVYLPVNPGNAGSTALCGTGAAQGCIAIFGPSGPDDHMVSIYRDHDHH